MKVDIPDEFIRRLANLHPDTPIVECFKIIRLNNPRYINFFYHEIGRYVVEECKHEP